MVRGVLLRRGRLNIGLQKVRGEEWSMEREYQCKGPGARAWQLLSEEQRGGMWLEGARGSLGEDEGEGGG